MGFLVYYLNISFGCVPSYYMQKNESYYKKNLFKKVCAILTLSKDKNKYFFKEDKTYEKQHYS